MEDLLESLKRIIGRWVETSTPITSSVSSGDTIIEVKSSLRFKTGDEVMIADAIDGEPNLIVDKIIDDTHIELITPVYNNWDSSENIVLRKLINGMFIEGIYIGDPDVIPKYPAITIYGSDEDSEWLTIESTTETYNVQISIYVESSTYESGYKFIMNLVKTIRDGLKRNIYPLVNDFNTTSLKESAVAGDSFLKVNDTDVFISPISKTDGPYPWNSRVRIHIEDDWHSEEMTCSEIVSDDVIKVSPSVCRNYNLNNSIIIQPSRFIYNSWPTSVQYGSVVKGGSLLQSATINYFAKEEEIQNMRKFDTHLK